MTECCCNDRFEFVRSVQSTLYNVRQYAAADGSANWSLDACGGAPIIGDIYAQQKTPSTTFFVVARRWGGESFVSASAPWVEVYDDSGGTPSLVWQKTYAEIVADAVISGLGGATTVFGGGEAGTLYGTRVCADTAGNVYVGVGNRVIKYNYSGARQWTASARANTSVTDTSRGILDIDTDGTYVVTGHYYASSFFTVNYNACRLLCSDGSMDFNAGLNASKDTSLVSYPTSISGNRSVLSVKAGTSGFYFAVYPSSPNRTIFKHSKGSTNWNTTTAFFPSTSYSWGVIGVGGYAQSVGIARDGSILVGHESGTIWENRQETDGAALFNSQDYGNPGATMKVVGIAGASGVSEHYIAKQNGLNGYVERWATSGTGIRYWSKLWPEVGPTSRQVRQVAVSPGTVISYACGDRVGELSI